MKVTSYYPVIMTERVEETAAFYIEHFGFQQNFASHWYVHLQSAQDSGINLAILAARDDPAGRAWSGRRAIAQFRSGRCGRCL